MFDLVLNTPVYFYAQTRVRIDMHNKEIVFKEGSNYS